MQLVIVESPAKAKTIEKYLGKDYKVLASYGHVRDLPPKDGSVRPDEDFAMDWEVYSDKRNREQVKAIADAAKGADRLVLATDPDREGEAISWHLEEALRKRRAIKKDTPVSRVVFNAITKTAVTEAMKNPRQVDQPLVDAYLARRALGPAAAPFPSEDLDNLAIAPNGHAHNASGYFNNRKISIYGGSNEIQRNILAKGMMRG